MSCFSENSEISPKADVTFKHIPVLQDSSAQELIELALQKFGIEVRCYLVLLFHAASVFYVNGS